MTHHVHKRKKAGKSVLSRPPPGTVPGHLKTTSDSEGASVTLTVYDRETLMEQHEIEPDALPAPAPDKVSWVDCVGIGSPAVLSAIGARFGLHALSLEDVAHVHQRPKVEPYGEHVFIVLRLPRPGMSLDVEQIGMFVGKGWVVTFQERSGDCFEPVRQRLRQAKGRVRTAGADYLAYCLLDAAVDHYFPLLERYEDDLLAVEDAILSPSDTDRIPQLTGIKRDIGALRRSITPLRDALNSLLHGGSTFFAEETLPYLRDCRDHAEQLLDLVEALRDQASGLVDLQLSIVSQRLNDVMKVLTIMSTLFMPLGFVAGLYGMNFDTSKSPWNMPELAWAYGYPAVLGLMLVTVGGLLFFFRRKRWL